METRNCSESIVGTRVPTEVFEDMKEELQCNNIFILFETSLIDQFLAVGKSKLTFGFNCAAEGKATDGR